MNNQFSKRLERTQFPNKKRRASSGTQKRGHMPEIQKGNEFDVTITEMGHNGDGIAMIEGFKVFVKNTEVNEKVKVKIIKVEDNIAFAERLN